MFQEHSPVALASPLPGFGLQAGDIGVVVHIHANGAAYEVEWMTPNGRTIGIHMLAAEQLRAVVHADARTAP